MVLLELGDDAVVGCGFEGILMKLAVEQRSLMLVVEVQ